MESGSRRVALFGCNEQFCSRRRGAVRAYIPDAVTLLHLPDGCQLIAAPGGRGPGKASALRDRLPSRKPSPHAVSALIPCIRCEAAVSTIQRAFPAHPADPHLPTVEGFAYSLQGDDAHALACFGQALAIAPGFPRALQAEASILSRRRDPAVIPVFGEDSEPGFPRQHDWKVSPRFTASAFPAPQLGTEGSLGRNTYDQPGYDDVDFTAAKLFSLPWFGREVTLRRQGRGVQRLQPR